MTMKTPITLLIALIGSALTVLSTGCGRHDHGHAGGGHAHAAPHGGVLVELGAHQANLEIVHDAATGTLELYLLDAHAENFVRIAAPSLPVAVSADGATPRALVLEAVANPATGETVGDTSLFRASAEWLRGPGPFQLVVASITLPAGTFSDVRASFPPATAGDGHAH
jgi:hypothetical protein